MYTYTYTCTHIHLYIYFLNLTKYTVAFFPLGGGIHHICLTIVGTLGSLFRAK